MFKFHFFCFTVLFVLRALQCHSYHVLDNTSIWYIPGAMFYLKTRLKMINEENIKISKWIMSAICRKNKNIYWKDTITHTRAQTPKIPFKIIRQNVEISLFLYKKTMFRNLIYNFPFLFEILFPLCFLRSILLYDR